MAGKAVMTDMALAGMRLDLAQVAKQIMEGNDFYDPGSGVMLVSYLTSEEPELYFLSIDKDALRAYAQANPDRPGYGIIEDIRNISAIPSPSVVTVQELVSSVYQDGFLYLPQDEGGIGAVANALDRLDLQKQTYERYTPAIERALEKQGIALGNDGRGRYTLKSVDAESGRVLIDALDMRGRDVGDWHAWVEACQEQADRHVSCLGGPRTADYAKDRELVDSYKALIPRILDSAVTEAVFSVDINNADVYGRSPYVAHLEQNDAEVEFRENLAAVAREVVESQAMNDGRMLSDEELEAGVEGFCQYFMSNPDAWNAALGAAQESIESSLNKRDEVGRAGIDRGDRSPIDAAIEAVHAVNERSDAMHWNDAGRNMESER